MKNKEILLTYASLYGSTQQVAETIAAELRLAGLDVDAHPMRDVASIEGYAAVVLGAAIYNTKWHPEAHQFVKRHRNAMTQRPVAIFALGPLTSDEPAMARSRRQLQAELALYPWLKPVATEMFVGKVDPTKLRLLERIGLRASDNRDWSAIRGWARAMAPRLQAALTPAAAA